jgi:preprotein translocase subunit Sec61beta
LDYDDPDEFPTERLTPRRITALSIAVSLVVIAVAGVVALVVVRDANQPVAQTPSTHVVETVVQPAPPPPPSTPPTAAATTSGQPRPPRRTSSQR